MAKTYRYGVLRRVGNVVIGTAVALGVAPSSYVLLTVPGRKSGVPRTIPIRLLAFAGEQWLVAPYGTRDWVRNVRAAGEVKVRNGRKVRTAKVVECGAREAAPVLRAYVAVEPFTRPFFDARHGGPVESFEAEADRHPVFRLENPQVDGGAEA
ncbi:nitroreductase family deazaflavin-dependent oxidoreductase [Lentzea tibetensis]|uniref:Nitroreductase family deazaflavin-dependent oxidoreductase n=1 Tax=Lentzea tibetensis TaxID=2591470 RepID=A0A563EW93_9PSEU|nr:nitroreductase family deazaflavin-dependent oxidoreductase [Lentzea tibetensis]TWP51970.1 nitroreductase family deazaflavin-dependent oxidoreductase [Lentzea tibetensis]